MKSLLVNSAENAKTGSIVGPLLKYDLHFCSPHFKKGMNIPWNPERRENCIALSLQLCIKVMTITKISLAYLALAPWNHEADNCNRFAQTAIFSLRGCQSISIALSKVSVDQ